MAVGSQWEQVTFSLQWHVGALGMKTGWDKNMLNQIDDLSEQGSGLSGVVQQKDSA